MLPATLRMAAGGQWCAPVEAPRRIAASEGNLAWVWRVECPSGPRLIESRFMLDVRAVASALRSRAARETAGGRAVLTEAESVWTLEDPAGGDAGSPGGTSLRGYVALGVEHILTAGITWPSCSACCCSRTPSATLPCW
jgi:hypothetical protein